MRKIEIIILGISFFVIRRKSKNNVNLDEYKESSQQSIFKRLIKNILPISCIAIYFLWGIVCVYMGYKENSDFDYIKEYGNKVAAYVIGKGNERKKYLANETTQYVYQIEFTVDGKKQTGKMISTKYFRSAESVNVYYLLDSSGENIDVAIADIAFHPGGNLIHRGIDRFGTGFFLYILLKEIGK